MKKVLKFAFIFEAKKKLSLHWKIMKSVFSRKEKKKSIFLAYQLILRKGLFILYTASKASAFRKKVFWDTLYIHYALFCISKKCFAKEKFRLTSVLSLLLFLNAWATFQRDFPTPFFSISLCNKKEIDTRKKNRLKLSNMAF